MADIHNPTQLQTFQSDDFLPPLSRWTTLGGFLLVSTLGVLVGLASVIEYHPMVKAEAIVRPAGDIRIVQAATEGTVESIVVKENQSVEQGDVIAYIDDSRLRAQKSHLQDEIHQCQFELAQIDQQLNYLEQQIVTTSESATPLIPGETTNWSSAPDAPRVETALVQLAESRPDLGQQMAQERRALLIKRTELQKDITQGQRELYQVGEKLNQVAIKATLNGVVLQLMLRNPGQIVKVGDPIAHLVPRDVPLVLKAQVAAQDIGQVQVGQPVQIRISAYPFPNYGTLKGSITTISPDAIIPESGTNAAYYEVTIQPDLTYLSKDGRQYPLQSGMEGRADIRVAQETVLTFFLRKVRLLTDF